MKYQITIGILCCLLTVGALAQQDPKLAATMTPNPKPLGNFSALISLDPGTGADRVDLVNQKGEVVCSYKTALEKSQSVQSVDPLKLKGQLDRFFLVQGEEGASGSDFVVVMDTHAKGDKCIAKVFESGSVQFSLNEDQVIFSEEYETGPETLGQITTTCHVGFLKHLSCKSKKSKVH